jgi:hypothetical protein
MQADKIFVSYSRVDSRFALKLAEDLQQEGLHIWIDQSDIPPSEPWDKEIEKALEASECILVILSPAAVSSSNVLNEINYGIEEHKPILPVVISSNVKKPFNIRRLQHIDFTNSYEQGFSQLLKALNHKQQNDVKRQSHHRPALWITMAFVAFVLVFAFLWLGSSNNDRINSPEVKPKEHSAEEKEYVIAGTVVDGISNKSIALAEVSIVGRDKVYLTEGNGNFRIEFKQNDSLVKQCRIRVIKPGYVVYDRMITLPIIDLVVPLEKSN